jgi:hypothetical protein
VTIFTRRVAALERALAPEPAKPPKSEINRELEDILKFTTDAELDLLEQLYRVAAAAGHDEPQGADRDRVVAIMASAHERRRQAGEPLP